MRTGFIYNPVFLEHFAGPGHPECPDRLAATIGYLKDRELFQSLIQLPTDAAAFSVIETIHEAGYIKRIQTTCMSGATILDSPDVGINKASFDVALIAAGAGLTLADAIIDGSIDNGFALLRPPGHHAEADCALGFCIFNNIAITARYLQNKHGVDKILILDWDVHHGNGTQHTFEEDPSVLYVSAHQYPFYPGTGAYTETGKGRGQGATLNCPMPAGSTDQDYEKIFIEKIIPKIEAFKPEFILISAGFDAHKDDPLAEICLSTEFFGWMTIKVMELAEKFCHGCIVSLLEGGYNLKVLPLCIEQHLSKLFGPS